MHAKVLHGGAWHEAGGGGRHERERGHTAALGHTLQIDLPSSVHKTWKTHPWTGMCVRVRPGIESLTLNHAIESLTLNPFLQGVPVWTSGAAQGSSSLHKVKVNVQAGSWLTPADSHGLQSHVRPTEEARWNPA